VWGTQTLTAIAINIVKRLSHDQNEIGIARYYEKTNWMDLGYVMDLIILKMIEAWINELLDML
jgi:hypothetical protein